MIGILLCVFLLKSSDSLDVGPISMTDCLSNILLYIMFIYFEAHLKIS